MTDPNIDTNMDTEPVDRTDTPADDGVLEAGDAPVAVEPAEDSDADESGNGNREAARYRRRLRETEAERDTLAARLEGLQRAEAERQASDVLAKGAALWAGGTTVADLLNEAGELDPDKIQARAAEIREQFGIPQPRSGLYVAREGYNPGSPGRGGADSMVNVVMGREQ